MRNTPLIRSLWTARLALRLAVLTATGLTGAEAMAQLGLESDWAQRYGSNLANKNDYGKGVTVLDDESTQDVGFGVHLGGTVVSVGEYTGNYSAGSGTASLKAYTTFVTQTLGGIPDTAWVRLFKEASDGGGNVTANGVTASSPFIEGNRRHAFTVGSFDGTVDFGIGPPLTATNLKDAFITRIERDAQGSEWVKTFSGPGDQVCLAVAAGPPCGEGLLAGGPTNVRYHTCPEFGAAGYNLLAAAGYFTNQIDFPYWFACDAPCCTDPMLSRGGEDAFLALLFNKNSNLNPDADGHVYRALSFGSLLDDRITAVVFDQADQSIYITGYFSGWDINFDPDGDIDIGPNAFSGGTDIFVAKYALVQNPDSPCHEQGKTELRMVWRCCEGTTGNDSGAGIALDAAGNPYVTGWKRDGGGLRDLWIAKFDRDTGCAGGPGNFAVTTWNYQYPGAGDQAGNGIALDGLDRILVTGQFTGLNFDFKPGAGTDVKSSAGGVDIFLTRLRPNGGYDGTYTFGGIKDDIGAAVAVDPVRSMRVAHAGWFGSVNVNNVGYTIDVDPNGNNGPLISKGRFDGYAAALVPSFPAGVQNQVTLVIDDSGEVDELDYPAMIDAYYLAIADGAVVPRTGKTALNAVFFGTPEIPNFPGNQILAVEIMPWTVIDNLTTATLFADRLRNQARWGQNARFIDEALGIARDSHERAAESMGLDACYHILSASSSGRNFVENPPPGPGAQQLQDAVFNPGGILDSAFIDQIDGFGALLEGTQVYYKTNMAGADVTGAAFALETIESDPSEEFKGFRDPIFPVYLKIMLAREAHCPGDYNGDGQVDGDDQLDFDADWDSQVKKADLNWDGAWDPEDQAADQAIFDILQGIGCCQ